MHIPSCSDIELLRAWAAGNGSAGSDFIDRHYPSVRRYFVNKVGSDELEDLVQQTFLACLESWQRFRNEANFRTFLLGIARFQLYTFYGKHRDAGGAISIADLRDPSTSPTGAVAKREDEQLLLEALRHIPLDAQELLELSFWKELSVVEIAALLELPVNTVYSRVMRAKQALRAAIRRLAPDRALDQSAQRLLGDDAVVECAQVTQLRPRHRSRISYAADEISCTDGAALLTKSPHAARRANR